MVHIKVKSFDFYKDETTLKCFSFYPLLYENCSKESVLLSWGTNINLHLVAFYL